MEQFSSKLIALSSLVYEIMKERGHGPDKVDEVMSVITDLLILTDRMEVTTLRSVVEDGVEPITPTVGAIAGREECLFYREKVNMIYGEDGSGKTLLMQSIMVDLAKQQRKTLWIDMEEGNWRSMADRLQGFRVTPDDADYMWAIAVDRPMSMDNRQMLVELIKRENIELVVIDAVTDLMALHNQAGYDAVETRKLLFNTYGRMFADAGAAVVYIDHVGKNSDGRSPAGSFFKRGGVDGAAYEIFCDEAWTRERPGHALLTCRKDRNGTFAKHITRFNIDVRPAAAAASDTTSMIVSDYVELDEIMEDVKRPAEHPAHHPAVPPSDFAVIVLELLNDMPGSGDAYLLGEIRARGNLMTRKVFIEQMQEAIARGFVRKEVDGWYPMMPARN